MGQINSGFWQLPAKMRLCQQNVKMAFPHGGSRYMDLVSLCRDGRCSFCSCKPTRGHHRTWRKSESVNVAGGSQSHTEPCCRPVAASAVMCVAVTSCSVVLGMFVLFSVCVLNSLAGSQSPGLHVALDGVPPPGLRALCHHALHAVTAIRTPPIIPMPSCCPLLTP